MLLNELAIEQVAEITAVKARGRQRRRLLDLGFIPGTKIKALRKSPLGEPVAYLVKGTVLALRKEEAELIEIRRLENE
ncbi:MAG: ferrous iron transport protein A [Halanaerobiales bacterium]